MANFLELKTLLARAVVALSLLALPMMAVSGIPAIDGGTNGFYKKQSPGAGFVLLVNLQRNR
ncbi:hypothetical protein [Chelativorans sp. J32]|uniref:hypothetical protein n=1 Tax=Chelativorans sp. J32 TaxID=935840 RepID=UPI00047FD848|nr:hypothetical protein [Chelativorans sp. J32]